MPAVEAVHIRQNRRPLRRRLRKTNLDTSHSDHRDVRVPRAEKDTTIPNDPEAEQVGQNEDNESEDGSESDSDDDESSGGGGAILLLPGNFYPVRTHERLLRAAIKDTIAQPKKAFCDLISLCANAEILATSTLVSKLLEVYLNRIISDPPSTYIFQSVFKSSGAMQEIFRAATAILTPVKTSFVAQDRARLETDVLSGCLKHASPDTSAIIVQQTKARLSKIRVELLHRASELKQIDVAMLEAAQIIFYEHRVRGGDDGRKGCRRRRAATEGLLG